MPIRSAFHVALFSCSERRGGERGLELDDASSVCGRLGVRLAQVHQLRRNVVLIRGEQLSRALVIAQVVIALGKAEPSLADIEQVDAALVEVGSDIATVERPHPAAVQIGHCGS